MAWPAHWLNGWGTQPEPEPEPQDITVAITGHSTHRTRVSSGVTIRTKVTGSTTHRTRVTGWTEATDG